MRSNNLLYVSLLIVCAAALQLQLHLRADASQEGDQLKKFIRSRRDSSTRSRIDDKGAFKVSNNVVGGLLRAGGYSGSEQSALMKAGDKIAALPGQPDGGVDFDQYSGYVTVDEKNGRALFYYLAEAPRGAASKPLLLWLNGGPGCSSFGIGAMQELGPFRVNSDNKTLSRNKNAWNNVANVIFLESPAGVGFSYSNTSSDYDLSGDQRAADDAYLFLVNWLERFPEYKSRPFYISGESYAGHYVPELAATILIQNSYDDAKTAIINLRGILVGNPLLDWRMNFKGQVDYYWSHGLMSDEVFANITRHCDDDSDSDVGACDGAVQAVDAGQLDYYNIYAPVCVDAANGGSYYPTSAQLPDPCSYHYTYSYLNDPAVQVALHARPTTWSGCANLNWTDSPASMVPTISWLVENKLPVWIFSGDFDTVCPLPATRYSIRDLKLRITTPWRPWTVNME
ncbi:hypothetical protein ACJX0J_031670, partial [Zea mays]